jgi:hypothetical protein
MSALAGGARAVGQPDWRATGATIPGMANSIDADLVIPGNVGRQDLRTERAFPFLTCGNAQMLAEVPARLGFQAFYRKQAMSLGTILLIVLVLILVGVIPTWPHSRGWGYRPTGLVGAILIVLLILLLLGRI